MKKEIVLPPHLYDRIKASAGEHGGIGAGQMFSNADMVTGEPYCAHGHAWGTCDRYLASSPRARQDVTPEPELMPFISPTSNDSALSGYVFRSHTGRIPFEQWCELLNVKRGVEVSPIQAEKELAGAVS